MVYRPDGLPPESEWKPLAPPLNPKPISNSSILPNPFMSV